MPTQVNQSQFEQIMDAIKQSTWEGASIEEILRWPELHLPRRTVQRRIAALVSSGRVIKRGSGKAIRYSINAETQEENQLREKILTKSPKENGIPISKVSEQIKQYIQQPIQNRKIVAYKRSFLDAYVPNKTFYLAESIRKKLKTTGSQIKDSQPAGTYAKQILDRLLIDLSWNSSRLEGNTYSLLETENLIINGEIPENKATFETQMIQNHKATIKFLIEKADIIGFNRYTILNIHALLSDNLLGNPAACGRLRSMPVRVGQAVYHPLEIPQLIEECFEQVLATASAIIDPFEQAFFILVHLPYLQPFEDVNKRVSRLAANIPFIKNNLCPLSFIDVPVRDYIDGILGVYECNQVELLSDVFVWAYQRSASRYTVIRSSLGEPDPLKLRYRTQIKNIILEVMKQSLNKKDATTYIQKWADNAIKEIDRLHFVAAVETELNELHEGNIARFDIDLTDFQIWRKHWSGKL